MTKHSLINLIAQIRNSNFLNKEVFTISEVCIYTGYDKSYITKLCEQRKIPHYKPAGGKKLFFDKRELVSWLKAESITVQEPIDELDLFDEMLEKFNRKN